MTKYILALVCLLHAAAAFAQEKAVRLASGVAGHIHPAVCISAKGTIVVIFSQADHYKLMVTRSTDGGRSWTEPTLFEPTAKIKIYPGSLTALKDGRIVHIWNVYYGDKSRHAQYAVSSDEGKTWGNVKDLPKNPKAASVNRHPLVELSATEWLIPLWDQTIVLNPETGTTMPFANGHNHGLLPIVKTPKGTFVSGNGTRSTDGGKTWQKVTPFPTITKDGWRYGMTGLSNGWLVAGEVIGPGIGGDKWRYVVSRDDGVSWDFDHAYEFYNPGRPIGGRACPKTVEIDRETIGTVYYDTEAKQDGGAGVFFLRTPIKALAP